MSRRLVAARLGRVALSSAAVSLAACSLIVEPGGYREASLSNAFEKLGAGCAACLEERCRTAFESCRENESCVRLAECRSAHLDPTGHWLCGGDTDYDALSRCFSCMTQCRFGQQTDCVGRYVVPRPRANVVRFRQRLLDAADATPLRGVRVEACSGALSDCSLSTVASTVSDDEGWYELELPVERSPSPGSRGFRGTILLRDHDRISDHRLHVTTPIFTDSVDTLRLFNKASAASLANLVGAKMEDGHGHLLFQVFDCGYTAAQGIAVEVAPPPRTPVLYLSDTSRFGIVDTETSYLGEGMGVVMNLDPSVDFYLVTFRERATGRELAHAKVSMGPGELSIVRAEPVSSAEGEPW